MLAGAFRPHVLRAWNTGRDVDEVVAWRDEGTDHVSELRARRHGDLLFVTARDVGERERMRARLHETETLLQTAFEEAPIGIAVGSLLPGERGRLLRYNQAWRRLTRPDARAGRPSSAPATRSSATWSTCAPWRRAR